jgi:protein TonB
MVRERPGVRFALAVAVSLALNAAGAWLVLASGAFDAGKPGTAPARVALAPMSASEWEANRAIASERTPPDDRKGGKVVELPPEPDSAASPDRVPEPHRRSARFLGERDQRVEKETVSRFAGEYPKLAAKPQIAIPSKPGGGEGGQAASPRKGSEGAKGDELALAPGPGGERSITRGEGGAEGRRAEGRLVPNLSLGPQTAAKVLAGPNMDGYRDGLEEGDETHLNVAHFRYATFINRVRNEIAQEWYPRVRAAVRDRDPDQSMFFYKDRTVAVEVTLDTDGRVADLRVRESSSVDFFDRVAVDSIRAAQPFPNPPRGLFKREEPAGLLWTFTFISGDSRPRLRWLSQGDR